MNVRSRTATAAVAIAVSAMAGCNGSESTSTGNSPTSAPTAPAFTATPAPAGTATSTDAATPSEKPTTPPQADPTEADATGADATGADPPEADTSPKEAAGFPDPTGETSFLSSVEIGDHDAYERVVFTFTDDSEVPSWGVAYSDEINESGSGRPVDIAGEAFLQVTMSGASGVDLRGEEVVAIYSGPDRIAGDQAGASAVLEVVAAGDFEAVMSWGIGVDFERPFRVFTLQEPSRVVIDVVTS